MARTERRAEGALIDRMGARCAHIVASRWFQGVVVGAILANALVLGLETYQGLVDRFGGALEVANEVFLGIFVVEILLRIAAFGRRPWLFFRSGWNIFDFCVIGAVFLPGLRANATALRLVRLLRVVRIVSVIPDLRVLIAGLGRSIAPIGAMTLLALFLIYVYAIVGWAAFDEADPAHWADLGDAMLTLFSILTLEGWVEVAETAVAGTGPWAWAYFLSFILIGTFVVLNMVIAVLLNSVEEAREQNRAEREEERRMAARAGGSVGMEHSIAALRSALDDLEREMERRGRAGTAAAAGDGAGPAQIPGGG